VKPSLIVLTTGTLSTAIGVAIGMALAVPTQHSVHFQHAGTGGFRMVARNPLVAWINVPCRPTTDPLVVECRASADFLERAGVMDKSTECASCFDGDFYKGGAK
jgi:hypothetical protein